MLEAAEKIMLNGLFASSGAQSVKLNPFTKISTSSVSPYGASKLAGEGYCSAYSKTYAVETVILRFGNVYGPVLSIKIV